MADPRQLAALSFFHGMPERTLNRIAQSATELSVPAGHVLVGQNDRATAVFFLLSGSVQILIRVGSDDLLVVGHDSRLYGCRPAGFRNQS